MAGLTPGVTFGGNFGNGGGKDVGRHFFESDFNVGGGRSGSQEILLDGACNTTPDINRGIINPPVDSVQEFKAQAPSSRVFTPASNSTYQAARSNSSGVFRGDWTWLRFAERELERNRPVPRPRRCFRHIPWMSGFHRIPSSKVSSSAQPAS